MKFSRTKIQYNISNTWLRFYAMLFNRLKCSLYKMYSVFFGQFDTSYAHDFPGKTRNNTVTGFTRLPFHRIQLIEHWRTGCRHAFCSCDLDLDLDPMTLIYEPAYSEDGPAYQKWTFFRSRLSGSRTRAKTLLYAVFASGKNKRSISWQTCRCTVSQKRAHL